VNSTCSPTKNQEKMQLLTERQAAQLLGLAVQTLRNYRHLGRPPAYVKLGRAIRYDPSDLTEFIRQHRIDPEERLR